MTLLLLPKRSSRIPKQPPSLPRLLLLLLIIVILPETRPASEGAGSEHDEDEERS